MAMRHGCAPVAMVAGVFGVKFQQALTGLLIPRWWHGHNIFAAPAALGPLSNRNAGLIEHPMPCWGTKRRVQDWVVNGRHADS